MFGEAAATAARAERRGRTWKNSANFSKGVKDPRTSNATRTDFLEMLMIALLSSLYGGRTCVDMADYAECSEAFLRQFRWFESH